MWRKRNKNSGGFWDPLFDQKCTESKGDGIKTVNNTISEFFQVFCQAAKLNFLKILLHLLIGFLLTCGFLNAFEHIRSAKPSNLGPMNRWDFFRKVPAVLVCYFQNCCESETLTTLQKLLPMNLHFEFTFGNRATWIFSIFKSSPNHRSVSVIKRVDFGGRRFSFSISLHLGRIVPRYL